MRRELVEVDWAEVQSEAQMHRVLASALDFPDWYGNNANALWDAITGLVDMPHTLRFIGWQDFARRLPGVAHGLTNMLDEMAQKYPILASAILYE